MNAIPAAATIVSSKCQISTLSVFSLSDLSARFCVGEKVSCSVVSERRCPRKESRREDYRSPLPTTAQAIQQFLISRDELRQLLLPRQTLHLTKLADHHRRPNLMELLLPSRKVELARLLKDGVTLPRQVAKLELVVRQGSGEQELEVTVFARGDHI